MHRLQRQMDRDSRWDSAIDRIEIKYGLHLDDWKRLGRDQMGQKCGRGWQGLRGACKRVPKGGDKEAAIKASKVALADRIRKRKGLSDRNAPKVKNEPQIDTSQPLNKTELKSIYFRLADGEISANELKAHWQRMKLPATKEALRAELGKQTIAELHREFPSYHKMKKGQMVEQGIDNLERLFVPDGTSTSFVFGSKAEMDAGKLASLDKAVSTWTDQRIKDQAASAIARKAERRKALTNPETLSEFRSFDLVRGTEKLTPEQRRTYEDLQAGANLERRVKQEAFKATAAPVSVKKEGEVFGEIQQTKHTKTGQDLHVVPMGAGDRLSKEDFYKLKDRAKTFGGSYSSYRGVGAIPGFQFKTPEDAAKFRTLDKENRGPEAAIAGQAKKQSRLNDLADRIEERASETLGIDRQVNTERRARMAGNVEAAANETRRKAETIRNLADADARGELKFLGKVSSGADIDQLNKILNAGHYARAYELKKAGSTERMEKLFDEPRNLESIDHAKMPSMEFQPREMRNLAKVGAQIPGMKLLSNRYTKAAAEADARAEKTQSYAGVKLRSPQDIAEFKAYVKKLESSVERNPRLKRDLSYDVAGVRDVMQNNDRLANMGITDNASLRAALREYLPHTGKKKAETATQSAYRRERELIGGDKSIGVDFFPTPKVLADRVASQAEIREGMSVLDPSAGGGRLSDAAKEMGGKVKSIEMSSSLQAILKGKGHDVDGGDFLEVVPTGNYDRVVMNPPFSGGADMEHVQHAYKFLKPGGKMVAIMSEGPFFRGDKKATQFRSWLDANEGESEKLPENSFKESNTGVNTRLVTITKPDGSMNNRKDSTHLDSAEITRYTRAIGSLNDRYGWHLDAQKVLSKLGKKLGKKCGGGWISPEKKCKSHYTNGKLNESGKSSGENLADRIRQRKKLSTVSRDGKGKELAYAFLPGNQKQSTMTARRTHAPRSGYQTPGRLSKTSSTEERRSMVGLGQSPWIKQQPDDAPMMDRTPRVATPIKSGGSLKSLFTEADRVGSKYQDKPQTFEERRVSKQGADRVLNESGMTELVAKASGAASISEARTRKMNANPSAGDRIRAVAKTLKEQDKIQKGATVGVLKVAEKLYINQNNLINEVSTMVNKDLDRAAAKGGKKMFEPTPPQSEPVVKASGGASTGEPRTRRMNTAVVGSSAGDRLRAIAGKLKDEESVQAGATVGILKVAENLYVNQNKMIKEVVGIVNEDLNNAAAKGVRKMFDPTQTPVRIPNQRSSSEPRKRGRSVD